MIPLTFASVAPALNAECINGDVSINSISIDSRTITPGNIFVALKGENFDGHRFAADVTRLGATGLVVENEIEDCDLPQLIVNDTTKALGQLANLYRKQFTCPVIAITGSSGKTSVKEMLCSVLSQDGDVIATKGNLNNHIGVPLTLFEIKPNHRFAVIEMGASAESEIGYLCQLALPDIAVVNNVLPAHLEGFGSIDGIARAKGEIYGGLSEEGVALINLDEPYVEQWRNSTKGKVITFGFSPNANITASKIELAPDGVTFQLTVACETAPATLLVPGKHNVANALAVAACACALGLNADEIAKGLALFKPVKGRLKAAEGINGETIFDDSYNANPGSVKAGIDVLAETSGEKIFLFGGMAELGSEADSMHRDIGRYASEKNIDTLFVCGDFAESVIAGYTADNNLLAGAAFKTKEALIDAYKAKKFAKGATVLVKGSRSAGMDEVVQALACDDQS